MRSIALFLPCLLLLGCREPAPTKDASAQTPKLITAAALPKARRFRIQYEVKASALPVGQKLSLWIPVPSDDSWQSISKLAVESPWSWRETREPGAGNRMIYLSGTPRASTASIGISYEVTRRPNIAKLDALATGKTTPELARWLKPGRLTVVDAQVRALAKQAEAGAQGPLQRARAYYDKVFDDMSYDKSGTGWGEGDTLYACRAGAGNCTDYHSLFISLCRAGSIPVRFQIGLFGAYQRRAKPYRTGGYHCWAEFHLGERWIPVDISEADKAEDRDRFFGHHSTNRVTLSTGRDVILEPRQAGAPLNYFVDPYGEAEGKPLTGLKKIVTWTDL